VFLGEFYLLYYFFYIIGNLIVLIVAFRKQNYKFVTNCYIINLAITDLLFLLISVPLTTYLGLTNTWILSGFVSCRVHIYLAHVSRVLNKRFWHIKILIKLKKLIIKFLISKSSGIFNYQDWEIFWTVVIKISIIHGTERTTSVVRFFLSEFHDFSFCIHIVYL
jgi:hypothetical protein